MSRPFPQALFALLIAFLFTGNLSGTTYYVAANGSDSNNGTSQSTPWAHLPGMRTWTGSHTPAAGDNFILRGCDDWGNGNFPITWNWSGTSGSHITVGGDQNWYNTTNCPSSWNRPVFDAGGTVMGGTAECGGGSNQFFSVSGSHTYVDFNWIELKNFFSNNSSCLANDGIAWMGSGDDFITFNNFYIHAMRFGSSSGDNDRMFGISSANMCLHCSVNYTVWDNSDGTRYAGGGVQFAITHSICKYLSNCSKPVVGGEIAYNDISHLGTVLGGTHPNCIETVAPGGYTFWIHDNRIHDMPTSPEQCETMQIGNQGETDYVWNNVIYNIGLGDIARFPQQRNVAVAALYFFNNTWEHNTANVCAAMQQQTGSSYGAFVMVNNHCITQTTPGGTVQSEGMLSGTPTGVTPVFGNNIAETMASANAKGYSTSETDVYSPPNDSGETVGTGQNLTSTWPAGFVTDDTSYACNEQTVNGVVQSVCPLRTQNVRPASGAWDSGAYQYSSAGPNPPTGLAAVVQ